MTAADRQLLEQLPPDLTAARILREALTRYRGESAACEHMHVRCRDCGADLSELEEPLAHRPAPAAAKTGT